MGNFIVGDGGYLGNRTIDRYCQGAEGQGLLVSVSGGKSGSYFGQLGC